MLVLFRTACVARARTKCQDHRSSRGPRTTPEDPACSSRSLLRLPPREFGTGRRPAVLVTVQSILEGAPQRLFGDCRHRRQHRALVVGARRRGGGVAKKGIALAMPFK